MIRSIFGGEPCTQPCADCAVRPLAICAALDQEKLRELEQLDHRLRYRPNEAVFTEEEIVTSCYNVLEGVLCLYKLLPDGRRQIVGFALPGDFLGLSATDRYAISADAVGSAVVCHFSKRPFARFVEGKPGLLRRIHEFATRELSEAQEQLVLLGRRSAEEKVATFLLKWRDRLAQSVRPPR